MKLRDLPSVDELARDPRLAEAPHELAVTAARAALGRARTEIQAGGDPDVHALAAASAAAQAFKLRRVINATGVVVHTNLGRAPLARSRVDRGARGRRGYSNLEYDLATASAARVTTTSPRLLRRLTGAEDALVVNNNAAARAARARRARGRTRGASSRAAS